MDSYTKSILDKIEYVYDHSGDGAIIHEAGNLVSLLASYSRLIEKEIKNPIMGEDKLEYYKEQLVLYTKEAEEFLASMVTMV